MSCIQVVTGPNIWFSVSNWFAGKEKPPGKKSLHDIDKFSIIINDTIQRLSNKNLKGLLKSQQIPLIERCHKAS